MSLPEPSYLTSRHSWTRVSRIKRMNEDYVPMVSEDIAFSRNDLEYAFGLLFTVSAT